MQLSKNIHAWLKLIRLPKNTHAWLQLIRPPNLITVPGDPLAGAALALAAGANGKIVAALFVSIVSLLLYISGLIMNDYVDLEEDKRDRPERPLPSGAVQPLHAITAALIIAAIGIGIALIINPITGITALMLLITIALYNFVLKEDLFVSSLVMGSCRGLSMMLGAFAVGYKIGIHSFYIIFAALAINFYIAAVTSIAAHETEEVYIGLKRWLPTLAISLLLLAIRPLAEHLIWLTLIPSAAAIIISVKIARDLTDAPEPAVVQKSIGLYIRILLLIQASICFTQFPTGLILGIFLLALWPLGNELSKKFYAS